MWPFKKKEKEIRTCMICFSTDVYKKYTYWNTNFYLCFVCWFCTPADKIRNMILEFIKQ